MAEGARSLSVAVFDGSFARVHYALVMASAAAATGRPVTLFFTGRALHALTPDGWARLDGAADAAARLAARGVAGFDTLLAACRDLGVRLIACEMGLRAEDVAPEALRPDLSVEIAGVVTWLATADGATLFV